MFCDVVSKVIGESSSVTTEQAGGGRTKLQGMSLIFCPPVG
jgi:hypothetical protein